MDLTPPALVMLLANGAMSGPPMEPWWTPILNGSIGLGVILWFMWRDGKEREKRDAEHAENNRIQRENIDALNLMTQAQMAYLLTIKQLNEPVRDLAEKIKQQAESEIAAHRK